ncbi:MAG: hypothetical protein HY904_01100 [Deltaproteobacteria bacterium]|nr:hypothetical protein [Deltaproteobacteria bacterium]
MAARKPAARSKAAARKSPARARRPASPKRKAAPAAKTAAPSPVARQATRAGSPPTGSVGEDAVERLVNQWMRLPKHAADYARLPRTTLEAEARSLLEGRADLAGFAEANTPIKDGAFDYLAVLVRLMDQEPRLEIEDKDVPPPDTGVAHQARARALGSLELVLARAEACGRTLRLYELGRRPWSPSGFIAQLLHVVQAGRRRAEKWDDPIHATKLFSLLERDALALERAWHLPPIGAPETDSALRTMALARLLYDAVAYLAAYGRAVFPPGDSRRERYLLHTLFPRRVRNGLGSPLSMIADP